MKGSSAELLFGPSSLSEAAEPPGAGAGPVDDQLLKKSPCTPQRLQTFKAVSFCVFSKSLVRLFHLSASDRVETYGKNAALFPPSPHIHTAHSLQSFHALLAPNMAYFL